jgi:hypothetical protein
VTGIIAALIAYYVIEIIGDEVGDLAFTLVAPLGTNQYYTRHR